MPTPASADSFSKLAAARARLIDVTKRLNESHASLSSDGQAGRERHTELLAEWDDAHRAFQEAADEFSATVKKLQRPE